MNYTPPKKVQIEATLFLDLYIMTSDLAAGKYDDLMDAEIDAAALMPGMIEKYNAMVARAEYAARLQQEKESR